ncbi:hypothetical protein PF007_g28976 [Phytophthora fragariae]|uniref:Acyltransferase 3 domain-containing protein n=1 Tax=Phytophthora fragariae TaxID=53985 RepID=A0A6A3PYC2_9STRA|nr:hypothetical protein PF007_g28976 [Phytophthora fragariae]
MLRNAKPSESDLDVALTVNDAAESQPLVAHNGDDNSKKEKRPSTTQSSIVLTASAPTKVLFLDGVRGLAALMVCTSHSKEYMADIDLGAIAVDAFFVLSSFLLTWLFMKKSMRLVAQRASVRKWMFTLADYFSKRFCRVYPLFALTSLVIWTLPADAKKRYYLVQKPEDFDLFKVLTFEFDYRYFVFWTLPLEITYYFFIPVFVLGVLALRRFCFVLYAYAIGSQPNWYDKAFSRFGLILLLSTISYHLVEYPSQLLSQRITKALAEQEKEKEGPGCLSGWTDTARVLANRLAWAQEAKSSAVMKTVLKIRSSSMSLVQGKPHESTA